MLHREQYYCAFNDVYVGGLKPNEYSHLLIVTKDSTLLPDSDRLILEDKNGFRYRRCILIERDPQTKIFEQI